MKLIGALAVPLVALVIVTALEVYQSAEEARDVRDQTSLAEASIGPASLLSRLEDERNAAGVYMLNAQDAFALPVEDNAQARAATDEAVADFHEQVQSLGGEVEAAYSPALDAMSGIGELRNQIDSFEGTRGFANIEPTIEIFDAYGPFMAPFFEANKRVALAIDNPELRRGAELVDLSSRQTDLIAQLTRDLLLAFLGGDNKLNQPEEVSAVAGRLGQLESNKDLINTKATGDYSLLAGALFHAEEIRLFPKVVEDALATGVVDVDGVIRYSAGEDPETYGYTVFRTGVTDELSSTADSLESDAVARQRAYVFLAALALGVAILVTWLVSRSITRPLRSLTGQATKMADHRLPEAVLDILDTPLGEDVEVPEVEPVAVYTRDEVADVAEALNTVQDTALDLAVEQAVLRRNIADSFVNLGRRNQNLLGRQLDFITELETNETSPDTLSNLFRLDHLATRMRRNAESLLVLAGVEPSRKWAAPVRLTDVIRAALGEVEDYQRVTVRGVEPATIIGAAAADLAHLLAELIENALVFSPPDQVVDIRGRNRPDGYTLAVIDSGLGMPAADVEAANRRLAGEESFTIAPSKYLGHYVAGNLAARHGITVHLDNSPGNGITATVRLPAGLLTTDSPVEDQPPVRASQSAAALAPVPDPVGAEVAGIGPGSNGAAGNGAGSRPALFPVGDARGPRPLPAPPPPPAARTASGLVKRARRGSPDSDGPPVPMPAGDLLASMSNVATNRAGRGGAAPVAPRRPGARPTAPPPGPPAPPGQSPWATPDPAAPGSLPRRQPGPPHLPSPNGPGRARGAPPSPAPEGARTASGLTRRVRGAQLPTSEPLSLRRTVENPRRSDGAGAGYGHAPGPPPGSGGNGNGHAGPGARHDDSSARDVYSFLTSFTAGVQRGLDEAKRHPENPEESE
jgi:signal transduction histidine kinase